MIKKLEVYFNALCLTIVASLFWSGICLSILQIKQVSAAEVVLPVVGTMVGLSDAYSSALIRGVRYDEANPYNLEFIIDQGDDKNITQQQRAHLVRYFLAALTVPEDKLWVNLSPYESDRIIDDKVATTEIGETLLAQDYLLKQLSSSLTHPETAIGKQYWSSVGAIHESPSDSFNKIWISPEQLTICDEGNLVFIENIELGVQTETDYLAKTKNETKEIFRQDKQDFLDFKNNKSNPARALQGINPVKKILIPKIKTDVNTGRNFAELRSMIHSIVLAQWFKRKFADSLFSFYFNAEKLKGVDVASPELKNKVFQQYVEAFEKGVYNTTKKIRNTTTNRLEKRKYFSGGVMPVVSSATKTKKIKTIDILSGEEKIEFERFLVEYAPFTPKYFEYASLLLEEAAIATQHTSNLIAEEGEHQIGKHSSSSTQSFFDSDASKLNEFMSKIEQIYIQGIENMKPSDISDVLLQCDVLLEGLTNSSKERDDIKRFRDVLKQITLDPEWIKDETFESTQELVRLSEEIVVSSSLGKAEQVLFAEYFGDIKRTLKYVLKNRKAELREHRIEKVSENSLESIFNIAKDTKRLLLCLVGTCVIFTGISLFADNLLTSLSDNESLGLGGVGASLFALVVLLRLDKVFLSYPDIMISHITSPFSDYHKFKIRHYIHEKLKVENDVSNVAMLFALALNYGYITSDDLEEDAMLSGAIVTPMNSLFNIDFKIIAKKHKFDKIINIERDIAIKQLLPHLTDEQASMIFELGHKNSGINKTGIDLIEELYKRGKEISSSSITYGDDNLNGILKGTKIINMYVDVILESAIDYYQGKVAKNDKQMEAARAAHDVIFDGFKKISNVKQFAVLEKLLQVVLYSRESETDLNGQQTTDLQLATYLEYCMSLINILKQSSTEHTSFQVELVKLEKSANPIIDGVKIGLPVVGGKLLEIKQTMLQASAFGPQVETRKSSVEKAQESLLPRFKEPEPITDSTRQTILNMKKQSRSFLMRKAAGLLGAKAENEMDHYAGHFKVLLALTDNPSDFALLAYVSLSYGFAGITPDYILGLINKKQENFFNSFQVVTDEYFNENHKDNMTQYSYWMNFITPQDRKWIQDNKIKFGPFKAIHDEVTATSSSVVNQQRHGGIDLNNIFDGVEVVKSSSSIKMSAVEAASIPGLTFKFIGKPKLQTLKDILIM